MLLSLPKFPFAYPLLQILSQTDQRIDCHKHKIPVTALSHAAQPLTVFTFPTILNLELSQLKHNFTCKESTTHEYVWMDSVKGPHRGATSRTLGGKNDGYFMTPHPHQPHTEECNFFLTSRPLWISEEESGDKYSRYPTETGEAFFLNRLESRHKYLFTVRENECIRWWWYGTRKDVPAPKGETASLLTLPPSGAPIPVKLDADAVFEVI